jgi:hypothetical protein
MTHSKRKPPDKPVVHPTNTGGLRIDSRELFTTDGGRQALRQAISGRFVVRNSQASARRTTVKK